MADNFIYLVGNIASDLDMRYTPGSKAVLNFRLAHNSRRRTEDGKWEDGDSSFFRVVAWEDLAENVAATLQKGMRVAVSGRIRIRSWENDDGETRYVTEIVADEINPSLRWATATVVRSKDSKAAQRYEPPAPPPTDEDPF